MVQADDDNHDRQDLENISFAGVATKSKKRKYAEAFSEKEDSPGPQTINKRLKLSKVLH